MYIETALFLMFRDKLAGSVSYENSRWPWVTVAATTEADLIAEILLSYVFLWYPYHLCSVLFGVLTALLVSVCSRQLL